MKPTHDWLILNGWRFEIADGEPFYHWDIGDFAEDLDCHEYRRTLAYAPADGGSLAIYADDVNKTDQHTSGLVLLVDQPTTEQLTAFCKLFPRRY